MKKYFYPLIVVLGLVACNPTNELGTPFQKGQEVTLTANIGEQHPQLLPGMQRVSGKDDGDIINLTWDEGDQILVKVGNLSSVFTLADGAGTGEGVFAGAMPADGSSFDVEYPVGYRDEVLKEQTYVKNGFGKGLMKMSTKTAGTLNEGFTLYSENALLGLQLTGNQILGKIVLTNLSNDATYTLNCKGVVLKADEATMFYIVVPVAGWEAGMRVEVLAKDGTVILRKEKEGAIAFDATEAMVMPALEARGPGKRIGVFSVSPTQKVSFSQGNLQYIQSTKTWQFAENQQEYIGAANVNGGVLADKIDLFGWSSDSGKAPFGISISMNEEDYQGNFVDWGVNIIQGDMANTWRTLSVEEWGYLFKERVNADKLYSKGSVDGLRGMIVLPDNWVLPEGLQFTAQPTNLTIDLDINKYTLAEWQRMEEAGAVFFCPTGRRDGTKIDHLYHYGCYWSRSRTADGIHTGHMYFNYSSQIFRTDYQSGKESYGVNGRVVRLVHDTIVPEAVDLGLSVKWASFNVGATSPEDFGDYFAWGETKPKENYTWDNYKFGKNKDNPTKYNTQDQLTTLLPEDDAVHVNWGNNWRMPTEEEYQELINNITSEWVTDYNGTGVSGRLFTAENGNTLFLPAAGIAYESQFFFEYSGQYWTSSLGRYLYLIGGEDSEKLKILSIERFIGFPIRGVKEANK